MPSEDIVGAGDRWIASADYEFIAARVPIVCVDVILLSSDPEPKVGLIYRNTYAGRKGWCLVGGAVLRNESLTAAVARHARSTLGYSVELDMASLQLLGVIEYFTERDRGGFYDPRKHAISLTYLARCAGVSLPQGEALDFRWFNPSQLANLEYGFGQGALVDRYVRLVGG